MKAYLVGGAVRDALLGLPVIERDWVVVGAGPDAMRGQGFLPADRDFPVFLHPQTGEEYALARREVKRGEGYRGFEVDCGPDVTLEEDLRRRDLTVNAMAQAEDGTLIDPFGGRDDLDAGLLRHVSPAFVEDPLRILRIARFAAKLGRHGFRIAHATHQLLCRMVERGDLAHLSRERVWRETTKAMQTGQPWRYFEVLHRCGALHQLVPPLAAAMGERQHGHGTRDDSPPIAALKRLAAQTGGVAERLAAVLYGCVDDLRQADDLLRDLRADRVTATLLRRVVGARPLCERIQDEGSVDALFEVIGIWRGFDQGADIRAEAAVCAAQWPDAALLRRIEVALPAARAVSVAQLRAQGLAGEALGRAVAKVRRDAMHTALQAAGLIP